LISYQGEEIFWEEEINFYLHSEALAKECDASLSYSGWAFVATLRSSFGNSVHLFFAPRS